jgi:rubrerythrin
MDRKKFLKTVPVIGATGALALTGCSTSTGNDDLDLSADAEILTSAAVREAEAINTYQAAIDLGLLSTQAYVDTASLYRQHHIEHLNIFNDLLQDLDAEPIAIAEQGIADGVNTNGDEEETVLFAMSLEFQAAQAYFTDSFTQLQSEEARLRMGEIFPIEVSHYVTLKAALGRSPAINAATFVGLTAD